MCSPPTDSQHSLQRSAADGACTADFGGDAPIELSGSEAEGAAAGGFESAPADVLDDDEQPLAEFHWASQARSSMSQPLPANRRRSSITSGGRDRGVDVSCELGSGAAQNREQIAHRRQPLQAAAEIEVRRRRGSSSLSPRHGNAAANDSRGSQDELQVQPGSRGSSRARCGKSTSKYSLRYRLALALQQ